MKARQLGERQVKKQLQPLNQIMNKQKILNTKRKRRALRTRAKIFGTPERPRLCIFRSNRYIYTQLIDDTQGRTLTSASSLELEEQDRKKRKTIQAELVGRLIAEKAKKLEIRKAVFDRRGYKYHGCVKILADTVRKEGIII